MKIFSDENLKKLSMQAAASPRLRQFQNIHSSFSDPCQRLFNAIEVGSYICPHRHAATPRDEMLIAIAGLFAEISFDDSGNILSIVRFGSEKYRDQAAAGIEIEPQTWHTILALVPGSIILEVKAGPFDPSRPKEYAEWAPDEHSEQAGNYYSQLFRAVSAS